MSRLFPNFGQYCMQSDLNRTERTERVSSGRKWLFFFSFFRSLACFPRSGSLAVCVSWACGKTSTPFEHLTLACPHCSCCARTPTCLLACRTRRKISHRLLDLACLLVVRASPPITSCFRRHLNRGSVLRTARASVAREMRLLRVTLAAAAVLLLSADVLGTCANCCVCRSV